MTVNIQTLPKSQRTKLVERPGLLRRSDEVNCWSFVFTCDNKVCNSRQFVRSDLTMLEAIQAAQSHQCTATPVSDRHTKSTGKLKTWSQFRKEPSWHIHTCTAYRCNPVPCSKLGDHNDVSCEHGVMEVEDPF